MNIRYFFYKFVKIGIIISLLTPLIIGQFGLTFSAFPKAVFFKSVVEITFVFFLGLVLIDKRFLPKLNVILITVFIYEAVLLFTSAVGINFYRSFFGDPERAEGLILHLHLVAFLIILLGIYKSKKDWLGLMKIMVGISAVSALAAMAQKLNLWSFYGISLPDRVSGTMSNPDFFAPYMASSIFLAIFLIFAEKEKDLKFLWSGVLALNCFALLLSGTRGTWVGFLIGMSILVGFFIVQYYIKSPFKKRVLFLACLLFLAIFALLLLSFPEEFHLRGNYYFETFYSMFEFDLGSRKDVWMLSFDAIKDRPVFGWGTESYTYVFDKYFKAKYAEHIPEQMYFDHPHNKIIEILVASGIAGMLSYLALFVIVGYCIISRNKEWDGFNRRKASYFSAVMFAFFIAYFFQNLFFFDTISNFIFFFFALAFVSGTFKNSEEGNVEEEHLLFRAFSKPQWIIFSILATLMLCFFYKVNYQPVEASLWFPRSASFENSDVIKAISGYQNSLKNNTIYSRDFRLILAERIVFIIENKNSILGLESKIIDVLVNLKPALENDLKTLDRRRANNFEYIARIDEWTYMLKKDTAYLDSMEKTLLDAIAFNPEIASFHQLMGEMMMIKGNFSAGEKYYNKTFELSMKTDFDKEMLYRKIGVGYQKANNIKLAFENYDKSLAINFLARKHMDSKSKLAQGETSDNFINFAEAVAVQYCRNLKESSKCRDIYLQLIEFYPGYAVSLKQHMDYLLKP
ncbi:MAG: O-antigen ligase family protein [Candidatus Nealsonbacteria bacterium]|nr:O-antigen ligase family protein [Candidatus Nealsonbacteria bacterium]